MVSNNIPNSGRPAITAGRPLLYTRADLEMAAFMASRKPWVVQKERYKRGPVEQALAEYDLVTEQNLRFLTGQENATQGRSAA